MATIPPTERPEDCVLVIFGASGDLTRRKLIPALYDLDRLGRLPEKLVVLGVSRTDLGDDGFRAVAHEGVRTHATRYDQDGWASFAKRLRYHAADAAQMGAFNGLRDRIREIGREVGIDRGEGGPNVLFYLSVAPNLYAPIVERIGDSAMVTEGRRWCSIDPRGTAWQRIIVEKPFGTDLASAEALNRTLGRVFEEDAIYRIDHYLGKELVQNILVLRCANAIFEPIWSRHHISHVQVTAAEAIGVGTRAGGFYDHAGALRDMIQSHLLQVLALVAMEPPTAFDAESIMREKIELFRSFREPEAALIAPNAAFGRYASGLGADGRDEPAYAELEGVDPDRRTETFAAIRLEFDTWRWAGVPFFVRTGKRMAQKLTEVVVEFKRPPIDVFRRLRPPGAPCAEACEPNRLIIRIAPSEGIGLELLGKVPGSGLQIAAAGLEMDYLDRFGGEPIEAYAPLLLDAMRGDRTLYKHRDEVEGMWRVVEGYLKSDAVRSGIETYAPGSWGPASADAVIARAGFAWRNPTAPA